MFSIQVIGSSRKGARMNWGRVYIYIYIMAEMVIKYISPQIQKTQWKGRGRNKQNLRWHIVIQLMKNRNKDKALKYTEKGNIVYVCGRTKVRLGELSCQKLCKTQT